MIPNFPKFKKLEVYDKKSIESFTKQYPPYSDFNFVSLWNYDTEEKCKISLLHNNLVIKFTDYITNEPIYGFLGDNQVCETIKILLKLAKDSKDKPILKLVPEQNLKKEKKIIKQKFEVKEDRDNYDYIISVRQLILLPGKKFKSKRRLINKIKNNMTIKTRELDLKREKIKKEIKDLFYLWEKIKNKKRRETETELIALERLMQKEAFFKLISLGFYKKNKLAGFTINEILPDRYYMGHFGKADSTPGLYKYMEYKTAKIMSKFGCRYMNYQQDLGLPGLRKSKQGWSPIRYLKKFIITEKI